MPEVAMTTAEQMISTAERFGGKVHGEDREGITDIEFPNIAKASAWVSGWAEINQAWLREPVESFTESVVVQVRF